MPADKRIRLKLCGDAVRGEDTYGDTHSTVVLSVKKLS